MHLFRWIAALMLVLSLALGVYALSPEDQGVEAAYTGSAHWHNYSNTWQWSLYCAQYIPDLGNGKVGANCYYKTPVVCAYDASVGGYRYGQLIDAYYPNGDIVYDRGPAFSTLVC